MPLKRKQITKNLQTDSNFVVSVDKVVKMSHKEYRKAHGKPVELWGFCISVSQDHCPPSSWFPHAHVLWWVFESSLTWGSRRYPGQRLSHRSCDICPVELERTPLLCYFEMLSGLGSNRQMPVIGKGLLVLLHQNQRQDWSVACFKGLSQRKKILLGLWMDLHHQL